MPPDVLERVRGLWDIDHPFFVRKIIRPTPWREKKIEEILDRDFRLEGAISLFHVTADSDIPRICMALNAGRDSLTEYIFLIAIQRKELPSASFEIRNAFGRTPCTFANRLHVDLLVNGRDPLRVLVEGILQSGRSPKKVTSSVMKDILAFCRSDGCHVVVEPTDDPCACEVEKNGSNL